MKKDFSKQKDQRIIIKEKNLIRYINVEDIKYITCDGYISIIHLSNTKKISVSKLLKLFESELNLLEFKRANRSTIVNILYIKKITIGTNAELELISGETIPISRRRVSCFRN